MFAGFLSSFIRHFHRKIPFCCIFTLFYILIFILTFGFASCDLNFEVFFHKEHDIKGIKKRKEKLLNPGNLWSLYLKRLVSDWFVLVQASQTRSTSQVGFSWEWLVVFRGMHWMTGITEACYPVRFIFLFLKKRKKDVKNMSFSTSEGKKTKRPAWLPSRVFSPSCLHVMK